MQTGGYPCGWLPKWRTPPRYADNRANRIRFLGQTPPTCPSSSKRLGSQRKRRKRTLSQGRAINFVKLVQQGKRLGQGTQSIVYEYKNTAVKVFDRKNRDAFDANVAFLKRFTKTGAVPRFLDANASSAWIQMQLLRNYQPLSSLHPLKLPATEREKILMAIAKARAKLPNNLSFSDLRNLSNIAYKLKGGRYSIKFYEGGVIHKEHDSLQTRVYVDEMASALKITRSDFAKGVRDGTIKLL